MFLNSPELIGNIFPILRAVAMPPSHCVVCLRSAYGATEFEEPRISASKRTLVYCTRVGQQPCVLLHTLQIRLACLQCCSLQPSSG